MTIMKYGFLSSFSIHVNVLTASLTCEAVHDAVMQTVFVNGVSKTALNDDSKNSIH